MSAERSRLSIATFKPQSSLSEMSRFGVESGLVPNTPTVAAVVNKTQQEDKSYFFGNRGRILLDRANGQFYDSIRSYFGGDHPHDFYETQFNAVNNQVNGLLSKFFPPEQVEHLKLSPDVEFPPYPAELLTYTFSHSEDSRLQYELLRQSALTVVAGELEAHAGSVRDRIREVNYHLTHDLFGPYPKRENTIIHALHDNETNQVRWIETDNSDVDPDILYGSHLKAHHVQTRHVDGIGFITYEARTKGAGGVIKAIRKAMLREEKNQGNSLTPQSDVLDIMGMKFIVTEAFSSNDLKVTDLMNRVKTSLMDHFDLSEGNFKDKNETNGSRFQGKFQGKRIMVNFPDMKVPLELMFHGEGDHLNNEFNLGELDQSMGKRISPQAHSVYEVDRDLTVLAALFPEEIYGSIDWNNIRREKYDGVMRELKAAGKVPPRRMTAGYDEEARKIVLNAKR